MTTPPAWIDLQLEKLTYGGDVMGRLEDGRAVFVPFGLPGERVRVRLTEEKRNFARGEIVEVLDASPQRINPRCKHFGVCGGCHYQHLPYQEQLDAKTEILRDQLRRIGKIENPPVQAMVPSPKAWNYRNHVQFHLTEEGKLGYVRAQVPAVFAIEECHLPEAFLNGIWPQLEFEPATDIERVSLRAGRDDDSMLVFGNPDLLYTALKNIVENGCKYADDQKAAVQLSFNDDNVILEIANKGDVIAESDIQNIFHPFFRTDKAQSKPGFGLGLTMAR